MQTEKEYLLAVNGTLMRGLELEKNMLRAHATFCCEAATEKSYRLFSVRDEYPAMLCVGNADPAAGELAVELWRVPASGIAEILQGEPAGLCIGKVRLSDGQTVFGVIGEPKTLEGMKEITSFGGWRGYIASEAYGR